MDEPTTANTTIPLILAIVFLVLVGATLGGFYLISVAREPPDLEVGSVPDGVVPITNHSLEEFRECGNGFTRCYIVIGPGLDISDEDITIWKLFQEGDNQTRSPGRCDSGTCTALDDEGYDLFDFSYGEETVEVELSINSSTEGSWWIEAEPVFYINLPLLVLGASLAYGGIIFGIIDAIILAIWIVAVIFGESFSSGGTNIEYR